MSRVLLISLIAVPALCYADVVWPEAIIAGARWAPFMIGLGLIVEWPLIRMILGRSWMGTVFPLLTANLASVFVGGAAGAFLGLPFMMLRDSFMQLFGSHRGTFAIEGWVFAVLCVAVASAFIEYLVLVFVFSAQQSRRNFVILFLANVLSSAIAALSLR